MTIQYFGHSFFKIETKNGIIALNPYNEIKSIKPLRFKSDLLLISENSEFYNNKKAILGEPFILEEPGEIEKNNIFVKGIFNFLKKKEDQEIINIIFRIDVEEISLGVITDLSEKLIKDVVFEELSSIDIFLMPVNKNSSLEIEKVSSILNQIEPKIFIPLFYYPLGFEKKQEEIYEKFFKEIKKKGEILEKLSLKKSQIPQETKIIILKNLANL
jgi:L-ascorbate metabolism protein UlaG (beta-lactamase superfamily)